MSFSRAWRSSPCLLLGGEGVATPLRGRVRSYVVAPGGDTAPLAPAVRRPAEQVGAGQLARLVRRRIEALHHIRDVSLSEEASRVRSGTGPQNMAMLRNLAIPLLAGLGYTSIPQACRWVSYESFIRPVSILGLP